MMLKVGSGKYWRLLRFAFFYFSNLNFFIILIHNLIYWILWVGYPLRLELASVINIRDIHKILRFDNNPLLYFGFYLLLGNILTLPDQPHRKGLLRTGPLNILL
jgi:hypothetical protein